MPNYKDKTNGLHFLDDAAFAHLLPDGCVEITYEEASALELLNNPIVTGIPQVVSKAQGLIELYERQLLDRIETYMATDATPVEQIAWKNIQQFEYASPMLNQLLSVFGLTQEDKDNLFISAAARMI